MNDTFSHGAQHEDQMDPTNKLNMLTMGLVASMVLLMSLMCALCGGGAFLFTQRTILAQMNPVDVDADTFNAANEGKLLRVRGKLKGGLIKDPRFDVKVKALKLVRHTEIHQWTEQKEVVINRNKKKTTYTYEKKWVSAPIDHANFKSSAKHSNPSRRFIKSKTIYSDRARVGRYKLDKSIIDDISATPVRMSPTLALAIKDAMPDARVFSDGVYIGQDPKTPQPGDVRIRFEAVLQKTSAVVGLQRGDKLVHR